MLIQRTILDRLTVNRDGVVEVQFSIVVENNGIELASAPHSLLVEPGRLIASALADTNKALADMGYLAIESTSVQRVTELVAAAHTPAVVTDYQAKRLAERRSP